MSLFIRTCGTRDEIATPRVMTSTQVSGNAVNQDRPIAQSAMWYHPQQFASTLQPMKSLHILFCALLFPSFSLSQAAPQTVTVPSGKLQLKALLWKPAGKGPFPAVLFNHGSGSDADHTAGMTMTDAAGKLAPVFLRHGYAFMYLFRKGQGLSSDQGSYIGDVLKLEEARQGVTGEQKGGQRGPFLPDSRC